MSRDTSKKNWRVRKMEGGREEIHESEEGVGR
jgi:hypothetical protein